MRRLKQQRDAAAMKRAEEMHEECMKDPEYAAKWNAVTAALFGALCDIPAGALPDDDQ
jgi:hypothetical protein